MDLLEECYTIYGAFTNLERQFPSVEDGLKNVHRRVLFAAGDVASSTFEKSASVSGRCLGYYHPHNLDSLDDALNSCVNWGLLVGRGNFGLSTLDQNAPAASTRYTEVKCNANLSDIQKRFKRFIPKIPNELGHLEDAFLMLPFPMALVTGSFGMGVGFVSVVPSFTPESLFDAYHADDPTLLKDTYGRKIRGDLDGIWKNGKGTLWYDFECTKISEKVTHVSGHRGILKIPLRDVRSAGGTYEDITSSSTPVLRVMGLPYEKVRKIFSVHQGFRVRVIIDKQMVQIGVRDWIKYCLLRFENSVVRWVADEISEKEKQISFVKHILDVGKCVMAHPEFSGDEEIAKELQISRECVSWCLKRTIRSLMKTDIQSEIRKREEDIAELRKISPVQMVKDCFDLYSPTIY